MEVKQDKPEQAGDDLSPELSALHDEAVAEETEAESEFQTKEEAEQEDESNANADGVVLILTMIGSALEQRFGKSCGIGEEEATEWCEKLDRAYPDVNFKLSPKVDFWLATTFLVVPKIMLIKETVAADKAAMEAEQEKKEEGDGGQS